jgi:hypothetical protein
MTAAKRTFELGEPEIRIKPRHVHWETEVFCSFPNG